MTLGILWTMQILCIPALSPLIIGVIRKIKAVLQNRKGASVLQPYRDIWKLLHKDEVISADASWIFRFAPLAIFAITLVVGASVPVFASFMANGFTSDILVIVYLMAAATFFVALAGMDTGSAFGGFGSSREVTVAALAEGGLLFSLLTVALMSGTSNVFRVAETIASAELTSMLPAFFAFAGFFIVLLAENKRFPFDNPSTHLELTMIHEAMILEYSGKRLALIEWASANKLMIFIALGANLFFPWGIAHDASMVALAGALVAFAIKALAFCASIAVVESVIAKLRFFRLPDVLFVSFILSVIAIGLI
ncbi:NADH-quinone oxidoreductase subunit H [Candidatus Azambacteria bacterium]|nr:NADH-quinone oxidoreductase subunit H [Candidatus Azambacteria bacterium]